jgi:hypothetical protein
MLKQTLTLSGFNLSFESCTSDRLDVSNSLYLNTFTQIENLASRISCIDSFSKAHFSKSKDFLSFIRESLEIIESENGLHQTKLERLIDDGDEQYRLTYYLLKEASDSITKEGFTLPDNKIYRRLIKNLSKKDKGLRLEMILDERVL